MNPIYEKFTDVLPVVFSQIVEGDETVVEYPLKAGHFTVDLSYGKVDGSFHPRVSKSSGPISASYIAGRVDEFVRLVDLSQVYRLRDETMKVLIRSVFDQIIRGESKKSYSLKGKAFTVFIEKVEGEFVPTSSLTPKFSGSIPEAISLSLMAFIQTKNLANYFAIKR